MRLTSASPTVITAQSGIALGPILFMIAILGLIAGLLSMGGGGFQTASVVDRVKADTVSQANLIRAKINECNLMYGTNNNFDGYPQDSTTGSPGTLVSQVACSGDPAGSQNIWSGTRLAALPPPTTGFNQWYYVNTNSTGLGGTGEHCIYITPTSTSGSIGAALTAAAAKFNSSLNNGVANNTLYEVNYDPSSPHLRFVVWITTPPTNTVSTGTNCDSEH